MSRIVFILLLNYFLIFRIVFGSSRNSDSCTVHDCNCNVQIEVVNAELVDDVEMADVNIDIRTSDNKKPLLANRVSKASSCMEAEPSTCMAVKPFSCMEAAAKSWKSGIYQIHLKKFNISDLEVYCEEDMEFGGWLVIQRRQSGAMNFTRDWHEYKEGFGELTGNYWIGLEKLHALTSSCEQELYIQLERRNGEKYYAKYSEFLIGNESESYILKNVGKYKGNAGDSLTPQSGYKFSTYDRDNDTWGGGNCAKKYEGGWWYHICYRSHLNGVYGDDNAGVNWCAIKEYESLAFVQMMIRPTQNCWRRLMLSN
ncbi:angiopoietin-related protein 1 [Zeugodacus cucurbitae]|uniref:angiopoietin-related protein 1 n=1 Tax=Zeugodacus cucurbitae TaxID=28588 RepID=UPI0023D95FD8|nr:angiopoietin-related protein 1 [Zeugodacus cucurbitae]